MNSHLLQILQSEKPKLDWSEDISEENRMRLGYTLLAMYTPENFFSGMERMKDESERFKKGLRYSLEYYTSKTVAFEGNSTLLLSVWDAKEVMEYKLGSSSKFELSSPTSITSDCPMYLEVVFGSGSVATIYATFNGISGSIRSTLLNVDETGEVSSEYELNYNKETHRIELGVTLREIARR